MPIKIIFSIMTFLLAQSVLANSLANNTGKPGFVSEEFIYTQASFPSVHSASILELESGELLSAFFGGSQEAAPDVEIRFSRKPSGGSWSSPVSVADGIQADGTRLATGNPILFKPQGGDLMLFYKVFEKGTPWWGELKKSNDNGQTWSAAKRLDGGLIGPDKNKPIQLANNDILAASATEDEHGWRLHIERSKDEGATWEKIGPLNPEAKIGAIQGTLLAYPNGKIQLLARTRSEHGFIAQSWSEDGGSSWSSLSASVLPNNNSGLDGVVLSDGRALIVYNHSTRTQEGMGHKGRGILNVALSDDGVNWHAAMVLEYLDQEQKQFSYPSVIQSRDGLVHIVYTYHRETIKHLVLDPKALKTAPILDGQWPERDWLKP
jgi:predicted neuraminidase